MIRQGAHGGMVWDVPPGQYFLYDLRENYTRYILYTGRAVAEQRAADATAWMREHAPWKDRTVEERAKRGFPPHPNARESLIVQVEDYRTKEEIKTQKGLDFTAQRANQRALTALNRTRTKAGKKPLQRLPVAQRTVAPQLSKRPPIATVVFRHGDRRIVPYAIWLEIAHQGRYSILAPAVSYWGNKMMADIQRLINLKIIPKAPPTRQAPDFLGGQKGTRRRDEFDTSKVRKSLLSSEPSLRDVNYTRSGRKKGRNT